MTTTSKKDDQKVPTTDRKIATKAKKTVGKVTAQRIANTGLDSRVRGHVSARGKRTQAKRDGR